jgi:rod shape-determining protein MreD
VKPLAHVLFALLLAAAQASLLRWVGGGAFALALPLVCVVHLGLHAGNVDGSVAAAGIGYVLDLMAGTPKGLMTFLAVALFVAVRAVSAAVDVRGRAAFSALSGVGALAVAIAATVLTRATAAGEAVPGGGLAGRMLLEAILTAAIAPALAGPLRRLDGLFHREEPGLLR